MKMFREYISIENGWTEQEVDAQGFMFLMKRETLKAAMEELDRREANKRNKGKKE